MNILYVSTSDIGGGAEREGRTLFSRAGRVGMPPG